jgi:hypothetical protein
MTGIWAALTGKADREESQRRAERDAKREAFYKDWHNPALAEFVGTANICTVCFAVTPEMPKHLAWHKL